MSEKQQTPEMKALVVEVAKDVLKTIDTNPGFVPLKGDYIESRIIDELESGADDIEMQDSKELATLIKKDCEVCALGVCFLSLVSLRNKYNFRHTLTVRHRLADRLEECFTPFQIDQLESAFEGYQVNAHLYSNAFSPPSNNEMISYRNKIQPAVNWFNETFSDGIEVKERLILLMINLIKNNGELVFQK